MKILIVTQKVHQSDPVLGFFHNWLKKISEYSDKVTVICLEKGDYNLPAHVKILSLGKEDKKSWLAYVINFYKYLWRENQNYDVVFVHMNQEYVIMAGWWWWLSGKKVFFWRNHRIGNFLTRIAVFFSTKVFCTSKESFTARFKKTSLMPVGIDTDLFKPAEEIIRQPRSVLVLGRLSPIKRVDKIIEALLKLYEQGIDFSATIVGSAVSLADDDYEVKIKKMAEPLVKAGLVTFKPAVPPVQTVGLYCQHDIYINLTPAGSMDKTIFEAMAYGAMVLVRPERDVIDLASAIERLLDLPENEKHLRRSKNRVMVEKEHSLSILVEKLFTNLKND